MRRSLALIAKGRPAGAAPSALPPGFRSRLLEGLTPSEINAVVATARQYQIVPHEVLQQEGDPATRLRLLVTGRVAVYRRSHEGRRHFLRWGVPGDAYGLSTALGGDPPPYLVTIEAAQEGSVLSWDRASARALVLQIPKISRCMNSAMGHYLDDLIDLTVTRASQNAQQRLARMLVASARQIGRAGSKGIEIDLTNEQLSEMAEVSLFTASRQLSEWQGQGILARGRGRIVLRAPERLVSQHF